MTFELKNVTQFTLTSIPMACCFDVTQDFSTVAMDRDSSIIVEYQVMIDVTDELVKLRVRCGAIVPIAEVIVGNRWNNISES